MNLDAYTFMLIFDVYNETSAAL